MHTVGVDVKMQILVPVLLILCKEQERSFALPTDAPGIEVMRDVQRRLCLARDIGCNARLRNTNARGRVPMTVHTPVQGIGDIQSGKAWRLSVTWVLNETGVPSRS